MIYKTFFCNGTLKDDLAFVFQGTDLRLSEYRSSSFRVPTCPLALVAVGRKGPRKGFKGFKGLKE